MTTEFQAIIVERDPLASANMAALLQAARDGRVPVAEPRFGNARNAIITRAVRRYRLKESRVVWGNLNDGLATALSGVSARRTR